MKYITTLPALLLPAGFFELFAIIIFTIIIIRNIIIVHILKEKPACS